MSNIKITEKLANNLKRIRKERNLSQEDLALLCDIDRSYIGRIERLERTPSIEIIERLSSGLNIDICDLLK